MQTNPNNPIPRTLDGLTEPAHPLCREDVIRILEWIKKKVAEGDPNLLDLSQPRLLNNFYHYAEAALLLIRWQPGAAADCDRLKQSLREASHGLLAKETGP